MSDSIYDISVKRINGDVASLAGMAGGVDQALEEMLGRPALNALAAQGRYRRDVY